MEELWREMPIFNLDSYWDVMEMLEDIDREMIILGKRIRRAFVDFTDTWGEKTWTKIKSFGHAVEDAFRIETVEDYNRAAAIYGTELAGTLYGLTNQFAGLKMAVIQAAVPIAQALVPVIKLALEMLTGLANTVGYFVSLLFGGGQAADSYAGSIQGAVSANNAFRRSLAGFDQINRLEKQSGSSSGSITVPEVQPLTGAWKEFADGILKFLEPLRKIDLTPLSKSLEKLRKALEPITRALFAALEWAWYNIFVPMARWAAEELLPVFLETLAAALEALARVIEEMKPMLTWLWENYLKPLAQWKAEEAIWYLKNLTQELKGNGTGMLQNQTILDSFTQSGKTLIYTLADLAEQYIGTSSAGILLEESVTSMLGKFIWAQTPFANTNTMLGYLSNGVIAVSDSFTYLKGTSISTWENIQSVWGNAWQFLKEKTMDPAYQGFRDTANGIIHLINGILRGITAGVNGITGALNKVSFTMPSWVPYVGGKSLSFNFPRLEPPQIPLLARGAVLPANEPFLAVLGDQKHGTNIEAPLATIQEAVAITMEDFSSANMAGHAATVDILRQLLEAVLGIQIGDETIAAAAARYERKMAMVRGGMA